MSAAERRRPGAGGSRREDVAPGVLGGGGGEGAGGGRGALHVADVVVEIEGVHESRRAISARAGRAAARAGDVAHRPHPERIVLHRQRVRQANLIHPQLKIRVAGGPQQESIRIHPPRRRPRRPRPIRRPIMRLEETPQKARRDDGRRRGCGENSGGRLEGGDGVWRRIARAEPGGPRPSGPGGRRDQDILCFDALVLAGGGKVGDGVWRRSARTEPGGPRPGGPRGGAHDLPAVEFYSL